MRDFFINSLQKIVAVLIIVLAVAVLAGGLGVIETASGEFDNIRNEVAKMRDLTDKPFSMNVALSNVKGTNIVDFVIEQGDVAFQAGILHLDDGSAILQGDD